MLLHIIAPITLFVKREGERMSKMTTDKKRITTYVEEEKVKKFKIISAHKDMSMSEYIADIINKLILAYEAENGEIKIQNSKKKEDN